MEGRCVGRVDWEMEALGWGSGDGEKGRAFGMGWGTELSKWRIWGRTYGTMVLRAMGIGCSAGLRGAAMHVHHVWSRIVVKN